MPGCEVRVTRSAMNIPKSLLSLSAIVLSLSPPAFGQEVLGALNGVVDSQLREDWKAFEENGWFVLRNDTNSDGEQNFLVLAGPLRAEGRHVEVNVSINSPQEDAAIGIFARNEAEKRSCVGELNAKGGAQAFCVVDGEFQSIGTLTGAGKMDGSDILEMVEISGAARFLLNGQIIGDVETKSLVGDQLGVLAYGKGTFGIADFAIADVGEDTAAPSGGSGLPPRGGGGTPAPAETQANSGGDTASRLQPILGPLAEAVLAKSDPDGWVSYLEGDWLVLANKDKASSEHYYAQPLGPLQSGERVVSVSVGIQPPPGAAAADFGRSAAGILIESGNGSESCLGEITLGGDGLVICFDADGKGEELGRLQDAAIGGGKDVLELVEMPEGGVFLLNGALIADLGKHPALGGNVGLLAYERGDFYFGNFAIAEGASPATSAGQSLSSEDIPRFGNDEARLIGAYLGITNGIFMHEFGHALIGELQVPSTGPEEDAVDIFSALRVVEPTMFPSGDAIIDAIGREVAIYSVLPWYYSGMRNAGSGLDAPWQDEHTGDLKRFRNTFCVIYGGNPDLFGDIAGQVGLEERTLYRCEEEFNRQNRAWRSILAPHTRISDWHPDGHLPADAPGAGINVVFEEPATPIGQYLVGAFGESLKGFAQDLAGNYALPRDLTVTYRQCGELNAWYNPGEGTITMCYDLIEELLTMVHDIEMGSASDGGSRSTAHTAVPTNATTQTQASADPGALNELADYGIPATNVLFPAPYRGPTPARHTRAEVLTTETLIDLVTSRDDWILIDTSGSNDTLPGARAVVDAGKDGSLTDGFQKVVDAWISKQTNGNNSRPVIFFGIGMQDRSAYNAALRAGNLGWNAYWYRGGIEAWQANGLPVEPPIN